MAQWFGPRRLGFGIGPRSWQGWLATLLLLAVIAGSRFVQFESFGLPHWTRTAVLGAALVAFLGIMAATYQVD